MNHREAIAISIRSDAGRQMVDGEIAATRRGFFTRLRGAAAVILASTAVPFGSPAEAGQGPADESAAGGIERAVDSYQIREEAARAESKIPVPKQITNGDEAKYQNFIGNFSKGLPHNAIGEVDTKAYRLLLNAVRRGTAAAFESVPLGGNPNIAGGLVKLVNPMAGVAFDLEGTDSHHLAIPAFPSLASKELAEQAVELYWMALCRDVNFTDYVSNPLTLAAAKELAVAPLTLFRGLTSDDLIGPYVSQLLLSSFNYGPYPMTGQMQMYLPGIDYLTSQKEWLACQNGQGPFAANMIDPQMRYIRNGRDFAMYVHTDPLAGLFISFYNAGMVLSQNGAPLNPGNPYLGRKAQDPFGTFGLPHFLGLIGEAAQRALKAVWYAKWFVHRALRPEEFGGLVHMTNTGQAAYPLHRKVLNSEAVANVFTRYGTYLLPQAFPEGCPQHPSYAQGHATIAGACATILKAAFDATVPYADLTNGSIVTASKDGSKLDPYTGSDARQMTVNGEINKLASNVGLARDFAGIHWRSDYEEGLRLGEAVALSILSDQRGLFAGENFKGFTVTCFDGATVTV